ncbi:ornithine-acyl[acyl carrier protein] N-acyltransferase [Fodinibius salinus]|uniref:Ornithine-acyl[acyl carrier protein] N-acyltransferase n=1 Tax=Fodinibius salinus TaxID=860790 RepID=A0A5D3YQ65_9BACT|nr:GNAT family N-acyltransferase [Fodinibius salinus]TYP95123.1 ornithine-acyl[acyl carrier protein] N-acyltransferase [Fodinibius salinus]
MSVPNRFSKQLPSTNKYLVRIAETDKELRQAQSLRYNVFNVELGEGLDKSHQNELDKDKYDRQCHHLLVIVRSTNEIIGTYRMQTYEEAQKHEGFYSANEFKLSMLPDDVLKNAVEVGRACIAKEHRNGRVLFLLWRGIAEYMKATDSRYLFGCCSFTGTDAQLARNAERYLTDQGYLHEEHVIDTTSDFECPEVSVDENEAENTEIPQLFRLYLNVGAKVISKPAIDQSFQTIDFLILVDVQELDSKSRALFLR